MKIYFKGIEYDLDNINKKKDIIIDEYIYDKNGNIEYVFNITAKDLKRERGPKMYNYIGFYKKYIAPVSI